MKVKNSALFSGIIRRKIPTFVRFLAEEYKEVMLYSSRQNILTTPFTVFYLLIGCIVCWIACYITSTGYPVYGEVTAPPLWNLICQYLPGKWGTYAIGFLLMLGGAFMIHRANYVLMLIREKTLLPVLFYILLISTNKDFLPLKSTSFGVFFLILAIYYLFTSYHDPNNKRNVFNATFVIAIGSLLWIHICWFLPLFWYGMYKFRTLTLQTFLASLMGLAVVYWFVGFYCLWQQNFDMFTIPFDSLYKVRPLSIKGNGWQDWLTIGYMIALMAIASFNILAHEYEDNLRTRQFLSFLILLAISSFALYFLYEQSSEEYLQIACFPSSILIAHLFTVVRNKYVYWMFHASVVVLILLLLLRIWSF